MSELELIDKAIERFAAKHPRPSQVTQKLAAEMLNLSEQTVGKMVKTGRIRLNDCGMIPITEIDRVLEV